MELLTLPGVFRPRSDSRQLAEAVEREPVAAGARALDLCTGSGVVAVAAARAGFEATAVDVSRRALATTWWNARSNGCGVAVRRGDLFAPIGDRRFDLITANPPYVPSAPDALPARGPSRAWVAGPDGRAVLDRICWEAPAHLTRGGVVLLVHSTLCGEDDTIERLRGAGMAEVEVVDRRRGPLGPLMREQREAGAIAADVGEEEVVVIRAAAPG